MSVSEVLARCTPEELQRTTTTGRFEGDKYIVEHPTRLHEDFTLSNAKNHGHVLLYAVDLGDGFTRATYKLKLPG